MLYCSSSLSSLTTAQAKNVHTALAITLLITSRRTKQYSFVIQFVDVVFTIVGRNAAENYIYVVSNSGVCG